METKTITGEIQNIKSNRKSLAIDGTWFNSFTLIPEDFEKGDYISIEYTEKKVDNKVFFNIKSIVKTESSYKNDEPDFKDLDTTTLNTIIMSTKEIKIAYINNKIDKPFGEILVEILKALEEKTIKIRVN